MFRLRTGYLISGIITGCFLLLIFVGTLPDGTLHIFFCNVGQGDAAYIRFPDGRDMVVDGGPDDGVINCLSRHMPFWDRHIDMVVMSHPQKDHIAGLISVFKRYAVDYFIRSDVAASSDVYQNMESVVAAKHVMTKFVIRGERVAVGPTSLLVIWPSKDQIARMRPPSPISLASSNISTSVLGATDANLNDGCVVFALHYGTFDALFPGDADQHVEQYYSGDDLADGNIEVLKVPHHGSKTGMTQVFIDWVRPKVAVISVGKNSYGHPSAEAISLLQSVGARILRTDKEGDIEVVSDGKHWWVMNKK